MTEPLEIAVVVTPRFNLGATVGFLDPLRAANYLEGRPLFRWQVVAPEPGPTPASNGFTIEAGGLSDILSPPALGIVSASWAPEDHYGPPLDATLRRWARFGATVGGLDTGAFILAAAGLLKGRRATVHYEHMDAFAELYPETDLAEDLFVMDGDRITAAGGAAAADLGLQIVRAARGEALANAAARYLFHERLRPPGERQNPERIEPLGARAPEPLRAAIAIMERNLEEPAPIPAIAAEVGLSQRQLERLFATFVQKSPLAYYRDIRLDRARGLVTQTEIPLWEVGLACGFTSPEHFSRAYRARFGLPPRKDRVEGRVPFEFRAWPMHRPGQDREGAA